VCCGCGFEGHREGCGAHDGDLTFSVVVKTRVTVDDIVGLMLSSRKASGAYTVAMERWKKEGKEGSGMV